MRDLKQTLNGLPYPPALIAGFFGLAAFLFRVPFLLRYDLYFCGDSATCYLMALRILHGDRPVYYYNQAHEAAFSSYLTAFLFHLFGPSISLGGLIPALEWSMSVAIGVYLLTQGSSRFIGILGGIAAFVSVPYTLVFTTTPMVGNPDGVFLSMFLLLQAYFLLEKGGGPWRMLALGFTVGLAWYVTKKCFPALAAGGLALVFLRTPAWDLRRSRFAAWGGCLLAGLLAGNSIAIWDQWRHPDPYHVNYFQLIPLNKLGWSIEITFKSVLAYFDAHPISRVPEGMYYWVHIAGQQSEPVKWGDYLCTLVAVATVFFTFYIAPKSFRERNAPLFLMTSLIVINLAAYCVALRGYGGVGDRYDLYPAAVPFSLLTVCSFARIFEMKQAAFRYAGIVLSVFFVGHSLLHQLELLKAPDQLREIRWVLGEMKDNHLDRVIAPFEVDRFITALSDQRVITVNEREWQDLSEYIQAVAGTDRVAVVGYKGDPAVPEVDFESTHFRLAGPAHIDEMLWWAPYQAVPAKKTKVDGG